MRTKNTWREGGWACAAQRQQPREAGAAAWPTLGARLLAALGPALRAGRLSAVAAIASGRAPAAGRGYALHRLAARLSSGRRLRLPRPVSLGLAAPFARPARALIPLLLYWVPAFAQDFAQECVCVLLGDRAREAFM